MAPITLAYLGLALMLGLAGIGSAFGVAICGSATVGSMKKNPGSLGMYITLSALPSTQGLYGFVGFFLMQPLVVSGISILTASAILAGGLALGFVGLFSAIAQARICASGISAIGGGHNVFASTMILAVFPELYAIIALLAVVLIGGAIG